MRGVAILLGTVALGGAAASPAAADSVWTVKQDLSAEQNNGITPQVGIAEDGTAIAVWVYSDPTHLTPAGDPPPPGQHATKRVQFAMRKRGENFVVPQGTPGTADYIAAVEKTYLSDASHEVAGHVRMAMNHAGDTIVAWQATDGSIRSAFKPHDGDFEPEQRVVAGFTNSDAVQPEVGIDGTGNATLIWHGTGARTASIYYSDYRPAGPNSTSAWGDEKALLPHPSGFGDEALPISYHEVKGSVAVDEAGNRTAVLSSNDDTECDPPNPCNDAQRMHEIESGPGDGDWTAGAGSPHNFGNQDPDATQAIRGEANIGAWSGGGDLRAISQPTSPAGVADTVNPPGPGPTATSGWNFVDEGTGLGLWSDGAALRDSFVQTGFSFDPPEDDPNDNPIAGNAGATRDRPKLATDGNGTVVGIFREVRDGVQSVQVALRPPPAGDTNFDGSMTVLEPNNQERSGGPVALSEPCDRTQPDSNCDLEEDNPPTDPQTGPSIAMNSHGEGVAVWAQADGSSNSVVKTSLLVPRTPAQPGAPPPIPLPPPPPARPKPAIESLIVLARPLRRGAAPVLSLKSGAGDSTSSARADDGLPPQSSEGADKLDWNFGTPNEPPITGDIQDGQLERSVRLRLPNRSFTAAVQAQTPDGIKTFTRTFTIPSPPDTPEYNELSNSIDKLKAPPVFAVGKTDALTGVSNACAQMKVWTGEQKMAGCMKPIEGLPDIPDLESGAVHQLADQLGVDETKKELMQKATQLTDGYVAQGKALLNDAFPVTPEGASQLVDMPQAKALMAGKAELPIGSATYDPKNGFNLKVDPKKIKIPLGDLPKPPKLPSLGGLEIVGDWHVDLEKKEATIHASLKMPKEVTKAGIRFDNGIDLKATPNEIIVEHAEIGPIEANIGALQVKALKLTYDRGLDQWDGQAQACALVAACLSMAPPDGHITVSHGRVTFAGAAIRFPPPGIELFPGIDLSKIGFGVGFDPTRITGSAQISAIRLIGIDGRLVMAFPSQDTPFILRSDEVGPDFGPDLYGKSYTRPTFGLAGGMSFMIPETDEALEFAHGYLLYEYPGFVALGGGGDLDLLGIIQLHGALSANMDIPAKRFNVHGDISECFFESSDLCGHGVANVSHGPNKEGGAGGCIGIGPVNIGGGVQWARVSDPFIWPLDGCKWSRFKIDVSPSAAHAAAADTKYSMVVRQGAPSPVLKLYGKGGAPLLRVTGPGGQHLDGTSKRGLDYTPDGKIRIFRFSGTSKVPGDFTEVGLQNADPGTYTVEALPGSPPVIGRAHASDQPDAKVSGKVTGRDRHRVLRYRVGRRSAQKVTFIEVDPRGAEHVLKTTSRAGRGSIRFDSPPGRGVRRIFAQFELDGMPAERKFVTSFTPASPVLHRPLRLRVRRRGSRLAVSWRRVRGATRYQVAVRLKPTPRDRFKTTRRLHATIKLARWLSGRVTVRAIDNVRQSRLSASRPFKRTGREPSPFRRLERCIIGRKHIKCGVPGLLDSGYRCLPKRLTVSGRRVGPAFVDRRFRQFYRRYKAVARHGSTTTFCVTGGETLLVDARRGRIDLVATTGGGHRTRKLGPGNRASRRKLVGTRRIAPGLYIGHRVGRGRVVYVVRGGRVRVLAAVSFQEARHPRSLVRRLRAAGLI